MALNIQDTTWSGTYAPYFILPAIASMDTVQKGLVYSKGDIKKLHTIDRLNVNNVLSPRVATPTDSGLNPITQDGRQIIPQDVMTYREFNPRDLEATFIAPELSIQLLDRQLPASYENQIAYLMLSRAGEGFENCMWMGSTSYAGQYTELDDKYQLQFWDGFMKKFVNDASIRLSSISPVTITTSNIQAILDDLITQATLYKKALITTKSKHDSMKFIMSPKTANIYNQYLSTIITYKGNALAQDTFMLEPWKGYKVEMTNGMADNTIIFCHADDTTESNLWLGFNSTQDWNLQLARLQANSELFFLKGLWKFGVQYGWSDEIFMYTTLTAADFN